MIRLTNASKSYDEKTILDSLTYQFSDTGLYHIVGDSGSGKTTLLRIIAGLEKLDTGSLQTPENISFCFQEYRLFPWLTALDNVTVAAFTQASEDDVRRTKVLMIRLGFSEKELYLYPRELSGGMKQRVSLARAFLHSAEVLILDEPTKELDFELIKVVYEIMKEQSKARLVIFTSHQALPPDFSTTDTLRLENLH